MLYVILLGKRSIRVSWAFSLAGVGTRYQLEQSPILLLLSFSLPVWARGGGSCVRGICGVRRGTTRSVVSCTVNVM